MAYPVFHLYEGEKIGDNIIKGNSITHERAIKEFDKNLNVVESTIIVYARLCIEKLYYRNLAQCPVMLSKRNIIPLRTKIMI